MPPATFLRDSLAPLVDLVFPPRCPLCGDAIAQQDGLCTACWGNLAIPTGDQCARCQHPLSGPAEPGSECAACLASPPKHRGIAAGTLYNEPSRKLVLAFKHGGRITLASLMAGLVAARLPALDGEWVIVPVPLHRWRLWRRGYNQAAVLARALGRRTGRTVLVDALLRTRATPTLGGLGKRDRRKALAGAITAHPGRVAAIKGKAIILVDDVLTSGATTDACITALKKAGAQQVLIACFARVMVDGAAGSLRPDNETPGV